MFISNVKKFNVIFHFKNRTINLLLKIECTFISDTNGRETNGSELHNIIENIDSSGKNFNLLIRVIVLFSEKKAGYIFLEASYF